MYDEMMLDPVPGIGGVVFEESVVVKAVQRPGFGDSTIF